MSHKPSVEVSRILTTGASAGQVLTAPGGDAPPAFQDPGSGGGIILAHTRYQETSDLSTGGTAIAASVVHNKLYDAATSYLMVHGVIVATSNTTNGRGVWARTKIGTAYGPGASMTNQLQTTRVPLISVGKFTGLAAGNQTCEIQWGIITGGTAFCYVAATPLQYGCTIDVFEIGV